jgi:hypothetical protein
MEVGEKLVGQTPVDRGEDGSVVNPPFPSLEGLIGTICGIQVVVETVDIHADSPLGFLI